MRRADGLRAEDLDAQLPPVDLRVSNQMSAEHTSDALAGWDLVCVGFAEWETELWTNQHHLMSRLSRSNRVLFVESLGLRRPQLARRDFRRMARRLRRGLSPPRAIDGVEVLSPLVIPFHAARLVRQINARTLPRLVSRTAGKIGMRAPMLWSYVPQAEQLVHPLRPSLVVYHCVDDIAAQKGVDAESFRAAERRFAGQADLVLASSGPLVARMRTLSDNVLDAPNVADTALFARALEPGPVDAALRVLPQPRIVFTGAVVGTKLDFGLIAKLARLQPDWTFALVGPIGAGDPRTDLTELRAVPNIHLLGRRDYAELPAVLRGADAGIVPYVCNELTTSIFPMKVYEYLAAGLPVIATPLPSLDGVESVVAATDAESMLARLKEALAEDSDGRRAQRSRLAAAHSWDRRLEEIGRAVAALPVRRTETPYPAGP